MLCKGGMYLHSIIQYLQILQQSGLLRVSGIYQEEHKKLSSKFHMLSAQQSVISLVYWILEKKRQNCLL